MATKAVSKIEVGSAQQNKNKVVGGEEEEEEFERVAWGSQLEFILTCIGFAVGLGNVWRFPYLVYENGGGAFLIPYFLMLTFVGLPLFYMECAFGQFASLGPITSYSVSPIFKGVGVAGIVVAAIIVLYYNVIVAWCLFYFFASMNSELPWITCGNWWNSEFCIIPGENISALDPNATVFTSSEEYYYNYVLRLTDGLEDIGGIRWQLALCLGLAWAIIFLVLLKGIESLGKVSYFVSLFPYVLLTIMLVRGATLPGSATGIKFYLTPDWSRLLEAKVWADAATQIFYSLGISMGGLIAMSSFNKFDNNIKRDALIIPLVNCGTSFYAGFVIFSVLGYMAEQKGVPVSEVAAEGPGLVFVVYPEGLATMPAAPVWSVLFFFMMTTLGFSSQFSTSEGIISAFCDEFPSTLRQGMRPTYMRIALCVSFFLLGLPMVCDGGFYLFNIVDLYCAGYTLLIVAFMEIVTFQYVYGYDKFAEDIALMLGQKPGFFFQFCWRWLTPGIILVTFISKAAQQEPLSFGDYIYPQWGNTIAWCIVAFPCVVMVGVFLYRYCSQGGYQVLIETSRPTSQWGPARKKDKKGVYALPAPAPEYQKAQPDIVSPYWLPATNMFNGSNISRPPSYLGNGTSSAVFPMTDIKPKSGDVYMTSNEVDEKVDTENKGKRHSATTDTSSESKKDTKQKPKKSASPKSSQKTSTSSTKSTNENENPQNKSEETGSSGFENGGYDDNEEVNSDRGSETDGRSRSSSVESSPVVYTINNDDSGQNNVVTVKKTDL